MSSCKNCTNGNSVTNTNSEITQKRIQNQVQTASSLYTMNYATSNSKINKINYLGAKIFENNIEEITITQTNALTENINIITAKNADISNKTWSLNKVKIVDKLSGHKNYENISY